MVVAVWSVKGGVGVTSVAAMVAVAQAERAQDTLLVDLCGDIGVALGVEGVGSGLGVADWCAMDRPDPDALARIEVDARPGLRFVPRGNGDLPADPTALMSVLTSSRRTVIVDCGLIDERPTFRRKVVESAPSTLLVMRACFLNLRAAQDMTLVPTGVFMIKEHGRHLGRIDVEAAAGAPVVADVACDQAIARSIDVGLARARMPRGLLRQLGRVGDAA